MDFGTEFPSGADLVVEGTNAPGTVEPKTRSIATPLRSSVLSFVLSGGRIGIFDS